MEKLRITVGVLLFFLCVFSVKAEPAGGENNAPVPTHADAAVILAKYSGLFNRYVSPDATLNDCVAFLNKHGVFFGLMEVVNGTEFTIEDCARVMGQIELVFTGEAEYLAGKVLLPKDIASWEEFCTMEGVEYVQGYEAILKLCRLRDS